MHEIALDPKDRILTEGFKQFEVFRDLNKSQITELFRVSRLCAYEPGEAIIREGALDGRVFFLVSGGVVVSHGGEEISRLRRVGEVFGEMSVIDGSQRSATVTAEGVTMVLAVDFSFIERLTDGDRTLAQAILYRIFSQVMADRLREADEKISSLEKELRLARHGRGPKE